MTRIVIIGLTAAGRDQLSQSECETVMGADLLVGGKRHLGIFPDFGGARLPITNNIAAVLDRLETGYRSGERCVVLASGDPLFFGIAGTLRRRFPPEALEVRPTLASVQLAFAALGEPWQDAALLSAHGRPLTAVVAKVMRAKLAAILTDRTNTPARIAAELMAQGIAGSSACAVCENLSGPDERIQRLTLSEVGSGSFADLNVFVVWPQTVTHARDYPTIGIPDDQYQTEKGQITKREIRLLTLAEIGLRRGEVLWDIGAGSGAVGIEAARSQPSAQVYAIEKRPVFCRHIKTNAARFGADNLSLAQGVAPDGCVNWPDPDAIFIGGSGGRLAELIDMALDRLRPKGRLVVNLATLENLAALRQLLPQAEVKQVQINRGQPIQAMLRFEPVNPIFMVTYQSIPTGEE